MKKSVDYNALDEFGRRKIRTDYDSVVNTLDGILKKGEKNYLVGDPDYLVPTISMRDTVGLKDDDGLYQHLTRIKHCLDDLINGRKVSLKRLMKIRFPYIKF